MGLVVFQITKRAKFQGADNEWSNRYVYRYNLNPSEAECILQLTAIKDAERGVHATDVRFLRGAAWGGGAPPNRMIASIPFIDSGAATPYADFYRECAYLIKWPMPRAFGTRRSTQRSLKKWIHAGSNFGQTGVLNGTSQLGDLSTITPLNNYANSVTTLRGQPLVAESDVEPNGPPVLHPYLEHHQFPRGRKRSSGGVL